MMLRNHTWSFFKADSVTLVQGWGAQVSARTTTIILFKRLLWLTETGRCAHGDSDAGATICPSDSQMTRRHLWAAVSKSKVKACDVLADFRTRLCLLPPNSGQDLTLQMRPWTKISCFEVSWELQLSEEQSRLWWSISEMVHWPMSFCECCISLMTSKCPRIKARSPGFPLPQPHFEQSGHYSDELLSTVRSLSVAHLSHCFDMLADSGDGRCVLSRHAHLSWWEISQRRQVTSSPNTAFHWEWWYGREKSGADRTSSTKWWLWSGDHREALLGSHQSAEGWE